MSSFSLRHQPSGAAQCADGRDNDGDKLADARYDSGCTNAKDPTERSPLRCRLRYIPRGSGVDLVGACSGPFSRLEIKLPVGVELDPTRAPAIGSAVACRRPIARTGSTA